VEPQVHGTRAETLKISIDKLTSPIYLANIGTAEIVQLPAVAVTGVFSRCILGAYYGESVTLEQDGRILRQDFASQGPERPTAATQPDQGCLARQSTMPTV
jgi:hypothetical protein